MRKATIGVLFLIIGICITAIYSCTKFDLNSPKADFILVGGYVYRVQGETVANANDTLACCYSNFVYRKTENEFSAEIKYLCSQDSIATLAPGVDKGTPDTISWTEPGLYWIELIVKNNDGERTSVRKYYKVDKR